MMEPGSCGVAPPYAHDGDFTFGWLGDLRLALTSSGGQNMTIGSSIKERCLVGDKGPGSKSGGKKPKGGPKPGDKKKR
jgi:hypothetical protein